MSNELFVTIISLFCNDKNYNVFHKKNKLVFNKIQIENNYNLTMKEIYYIINHDISYDVFLKLKTCQNCNKLTNRFVKQSRGYTTYCSKQCANSSCNVKEKRNATNLIKYGTTNPLCSDICKQKSKETSLNKYGVEYPSQSTEFRERVKETCLKKYNTTNILKLPEVRLKIKQTSRLKYGSDCFLSSKEYQEIKKKKCIELNGVEYYTQTTQFREKCRKTLMLKYGVDNPMHLKSFKKKMIQTNLKRYGVKHITSSHIKNKKHLNRSFVTKHFIQDGYFLNDEFIKYFGITDTMIGYYKNLWGIKNNTKINKQRQQNRLCDELKSTGCCVVSNNRRILNGKEIDIVVDEKIAIEYNGLMFHSHGNSNVKKFERNINNMYHMEKAINIISNQLHPLFIFEHEYKENKEFFISFIKRIKSPIKDTNIIYKQISNTEAEQFISKNEPRSNDIQRNICVGGYIEDKLCIVCVFYMIQNIIEIQNIVFNINNIGCNFLSLFEFLKNKYPNKSIFWYDDLKYCKHLLIPAQNRALCGYIKPKCFYFKPHPFMLYYNKPTETSLDIRWFHDCGKVIVEIKP